MERLAILGRAAHPDPCADNNIVATTSPKTSNLDQAISDSASGPKRAQGDSGSVEQHPLKEVVEADRYLSSKDAAKRPDRGLRMSRLAPPGAGEMA